jgi:MFS transporter, BCD family, chlorophyll transporter
MDAKQEQHLTLGRNVKIGLFHLGSGMADIITTGVWNRIMISDLGFAATPVGLLVSLRYFLAPLGIWAGRISDQRTILGFRRLFWIWLGRAMMVISTITLGWQTAALVSGADVNALVWVIFALSLLLFSMGQAISGSTFLALIYDRAAPKQRGRAVGIVWTFLLLGFTVGGILFGVLLPHDAEGPAAGPGFTAETVLLLFVVAGLVMGAIWLFSVLGEERRVDTLPPSQIGPSDESDSSSVWADLRLVWVSRSMRFFMFYLSLSMIFAFSQDLVLEPFAGDVFDMSARTTTKFAAYWGSMSIVGTLAFIWLSRKYEFLTNTMMSYAGVVVLAVSFIGFSVSALGEVRWLVTPGLIFLGLGLGFWNVGTLGLMMDMSPVGRAGTFLGFWTLVVTFARGFGISGGGIVRDMVLQFTGTLNVSYGAVFVLGVFGLLLSLYTLSQVNVKAFAAERSDDVDTIFAGAME